MMMTNKTKRMTVQEYQRSKKYNKYRNHKITTDGYLFDSKLEAEYYKELKIRQRTGDIQSFCLQPKYLLQPSYNKHGQTYRKIEYIADFEILHKDGTVEVIDVKGKRTQVFNLKQKLFHHKYSYKLTLITKNDVKRRR